MKQYEEFNNIIRQLRDLDWKLYRKCGLRIKLFAEGKKFNKNNYGFGYRFFFNPHNIDLRNYYATGLLLLDFYSPSSDDDILGKLIVGKYLTQIKDLIKLNLEKLLPSLNKKKNKR